MQVLLDGDHPPGSSSSPPSPLSSGAGLSDSGFSCLLAAVFSVISRKEFVNP